MELLPYIIRPYDRTIKFSGTDGEDVWVVKVLHSLNDDITSSLTAGIQEKQS